MIITLVKKLVLLSLRKKFNEVSEGELDELQKQNMQKKRYDGNEINECDWWKMYKTDDNGKQHLHEFFPYKMLLREDRLMENIKSGSLIVYVQCDIEKPESLREVFANFPSVFKNINVNRDDIGPFIKEYAEKEFWFSLGECYYQTISWRMEQSLHRWCSFTWTWGWFAKNFIALCNTLQWSASTTSFNLLWKLEQRETRIPILV